MVEVPAPPVEEVVAEPVAAYVPMEPMSPAPSPPRFWCDFCKEFTSIPHTLEYSYSLPTPTPASPTPVATGNGVPPLDPWFLNTRAAPALDAMKIEEEDEDMVAAPGVSNLFNPGGMHVASTGVPLYSFFDAAGPSATPPAATTPMAPPPSVALPLPWMTPAPAAASSAATRAEAVARMKAQALPMVPPTSTEGTATTPPTIRRLLGRRVAAVDRRPGIRRGTWNPAVLSLPSAEVLNMASGGSDFFSPEDGDSSSN